jgi:A/G-specific adenine glycosylase
VADQRGEIPQDAETFRKLPGVGRYTCGAVLSIAFGRPLPVLDGNVARVLARLFARPVSVREPRGARELWALAERLVPMRGAGDWNQALMELGATCCTPRPGCAGCPMRTWCRAFATNSMDRCPKPVARPATRHVRRAVAIVRRGGKWLLVRRSGTWLDGLWEPPGVTLAARAAEHSAGVALGAELSRLGVPIVELSATDRRVRHRITRHAITVDVWEGRARGAVRRSDKSRWVDPHRPDVALTGLTRKLVRGDAPTRTRRGA